MGRGTYDVFAPAWSTRSGDPYSDRINTMRRVVGHPPEAWRHPL
jgi:hypothetical protein